MEIENKDSNELIGDANTKNKTKYQQLDIPGSIKIGVYTYIFKDKSKTNNNIFFYRCQKTNCRITIEISRDNIKKIINKNPNTEIIYKQKNEHKCIIIDNQKTEKIEECNTEDEIINKAKSIININPLKSLSYQQLKLHENNIHLSDNKVKNIIYNIRNSIFPKDDEYIMNINNIKITFDDKIPNSKNLPFCLNNTKFFNPQKNRIEQFIIFFSKFQLKILTEATNFFIDAIFKVAPKNFYQVLNILAYNDNTKFIALVCFILMTNKSYNSYIKIFQEIKFLLENYDLPWKYNDAKFMCDFEKSLMNSLKKEFKNSKINGCYFHYIKSLWKKVRKLGLTKSKYIDSTKIIVFALKIYPFILDKNKEKYMNEIFEYAKSKSKDYNSFIKYYIKNWSQSNFLKFDLINNGEIINRTNNYFESFHHKLNQTIGMSYPRISILTEELIDLSIEYYISYVEKIFENNLNNKENISIYNDILNFLRKFFVKYDKNIDVKLLLQDSGETRKNFEDITNDIVLNYLIFKKRKIIKKMILNLI